MKRKGRFPTTHIEQTIAVPRCRIGAVITRLNASIFSRNARKFGKHRRGTIVLSRYDGKLTASGKWEIKLQFTAYKGYTVYHNDIGVPVVVDNPNADSHTDFRKLYR